MTTQGLLSGFGSDHESEAIDGVLPTRGNSPQRPAEGLVTEQISGTAFTAPRATNARTWLYRRRPSVRHVRNLTPVLFPLWVTAPDQNPAWLAQSRWTTETTAERSTGTTGVPSANWLDSVTTVVTNGSGHLQCGGAIHTYRFGRDSPERRTAFVNADAEMLFIPAVGRLDLVTELGRLPVPPGHIAIVPRGIKVEVGTFDEVADGWLHENYGQPFQLPDPGVVGLNALAMPKDFHYPTAAPDPEPAGGGEPAGGADRPWRMVIKAAGRFGETELEHSPLDVVAWRGNYAPCVYDLRAFCPIGPALFDHPDPSLGTVLTSPSDLAGTANIDFVIFRERWLVAEDTFRPPWFHSNTMSEFMGLIDGSYDARPDQKPGTMTLHNQFMPHGPDTNAYRAAEQAELAPQRLEPTMAFMLESRYVWQPTQWAATADRLDPDYDRIWLP